MLIWLGQMLHQNYGWGRYPFPPFSFVDCLLENSRMLIQNGQKNGGREGNMRDYERDGRKAIHGITNLGNHQG
jgi:hypothetical protein